jgi:hypothetical protein
MKSETIAEIYWHISQVQKTSVSETCVNQGCEFLQVYPDFGTRQLFLPSEGFEEILKKLLISFIKIITPLIPITLLSPSILTVEIRFSNALFVGYQELNLQGIQSFHFILN